MNDGLLRINAGCSIPAAELSFSYSRAAGPGGQHVNKVNSRVTLWFDLANSPSLTPTQKRQLHRRLANRINKDGVLHLVCMQHRSQHANRLAAIERFTHLVAEGLRRPKKRVATKVPKGEKKRRLAQKKHRSRVKQLRCVRGQDEEGRG